MSDMEDMWRAIKKANDQIEQLEMTVANLVAKQNELHDIIQTEVQMIPYSERR